MTDVQPSGIAVGDPFEGAGLPLAVARMLRHVAREDIPRSEDLVTAPALEAELRRRNEPELSLIAVGDIMLAGRAQPVLGERGPDHPFVAVLPLLRRAPIVLGNLEGPFALVARRERRNHSYRVDPGLAHALKRAGINVVTLANNHLLDCGRAGVLETLAALEQAGVAAVGAGVNERAAHRPVICVANGQRVGVLGYYWNRRCAARAGLPGSAMDPPDALAADIPALRALVDRVVVTFHWGVPYEREPAPEVRTKARFAIDCGADVVIGHHPHIVQPAEVYRERPILYSVGNFAFGSGNSRAEGLVVGVRFDRHETTVEVYPLYVKNRDPRVNYQPKLLRGSGAERVLRRLRHISASAGDWLDIVDDRIRLTLPRACGEGAGGLDR
ncbi:MAG TPA: CapA family protein [Gemmatimonadales bacterium]|nr:CapA family protein [Gemmatimonadales bacterium]